MSHKVKIGAAAITLSVVAVSGYFIVTSRGNAQGAVRIIDAEVSRETLTTSVSSSGQIEDMHQVTIRPTSSGTVASVLTEEGQAVTVGQVIAQLQTADLAARLRQEQADWLNADAKLKDAIEGSSPEELYLQQLSVTNAQRDLADARNDFLKAEVDAAQAVDDAYAAAFATLENDVNLDAQEAMSKLDTFYSFACDYDCMRSSGFYVVSMESVNDADETKPAANSALADIRKEIDGLGTSPTDSEVDAALSVIRDAAYTMRIAAIATYDALQDDSDKVTVGSAWSAMTAIIESLDAEIASTADARADGVQDVVDAGAAVDTAERALEEKEAQFVVDSAPPTAADLAILRANLAGAAADLTAARVTLAEATLTSPVDGTIATFDVGLGDAVTISTVVATILSNNPVAVVQFNEVDIAQIAVGQPARIEVDAIEGLQLTGTVASVAATGTVSSGVVTFEVTVGVDVTDERIKPGMTANVTIITEAKTDVLVVPSAAIQYTSGSPSVRVMNSDGVTFVSRPVTLGISSDTEIEILSGVSEGERVVVQITTVSDDGSETRTSQGQQGGGAGFRLPGSGGGGGGVNRETFQNLRNLR